MKFIHVYMPVHMHTHSAATNLFKDSVVSHFFCRFIPYNQYLEEEKCNIFSLC